MLKGKGLTYVKVGELMGESARTLKYWVRKYLDEGLAGLREEEIPGRPRRLSEGQMREIASTIRQPPATAGMPGGRWSATKLAVWIERQYSVRFSESHVRRILRDLGVRSAWAKKRP
jgi:transposase